MFEKRLSTWLQLDNQSTNNIFCNKDYLVNIQKTNKILELKTNGGDLKTNYQGGFPGFGIVWNDPNGMTTSQAIFEGMSYDVENKHEKKCIVTGNKGKIHFHRSPEGLYYMPL